MQPLENTLVGLAVALGIGLMIGTERERNKGQGANRAIAGVRMENYLDWMKSSYYITITSHPAISVPAGFTGDEPPLPVGLQIVGRYRDDLGVLQLAHAFEGATQHWKHRPPIAG